MNFSFENQGTNTYLVMEIPADAEMDTMTIGMITNNSIPGVASAVFTQLDNTRYVKYNISAKISLAQLFEGTVNKRKILGVFTGICNALQNAEDYMLEYNNFIYDVNRIFVNVSTLDVSLICIPILSEEQNVSNLGVFFKNIMFSSQFDTTENNDYVGKIINYLNSSASFSIKEFKELLDMLQGNAPAAAPVPAPAPAVATVPMAAPAQAVVSAPQPVSMPQVSAQPASAPAVSQQPINTSQTGANAQAQVNVPVPPVAAPTLVTPIPQPVANSGIAIPPMGMAQPPAKNGKEKKVKPAKEPKQPKASKEPKSLKPPKKEKVKGMGAPVPGMAIPGQPGQSIMSQSMAQPVVAQPVMPAVRPMAQPAAPQPVTPQPVFNVAAPQPAATKATGFTGNFGETTVLGSTPIIGETTVLGVSPMAQAQPYLIRKKTDERIPLNKPVFRIGKEKSYVDYFISDNTAISRSHANIIMREGKYYVMDTNSTNHTFVNGQLLQSNVETEISHGAVVKLANEEFEFRAY